MADMHDLFASSTFATAHPLQFHAPRTNPVPEFQPVILAEAPPDVLTMPERDIEEKIAKAVAVLKWAMSHFEICYSFSGGKDSSTVLSLGLAAAAALKVEGTPIKRFLILNSDTLIENPEVVGVVRTELAHIRAWIREFDLPGTIEVTQPALLDEWAVSIIGGQTLLSTPMTNRNCTADLKSSPLTRARARLLGTNKIASGKFTVGVTGVRYAESAERASNMTKRAESATQVVQTNAKQDVFLAPIADWTTDDVMEYIGLAVNDLLPIRIYSTFVDVWRIYKDAEGECTVGRGDKPSKGCSARHGCFTCSMVAADKSMDAFLASPQYAYMAPLARFREYLNNTLFDMDKRYWIGRSIHAGHVEYAPTVYAPAYVQDLLRFALTLDRDEAQAAQVLGIQPRFQIVSLSALIAIDCVWSLHAYTAPFAALKIYHDVYVKGLRFEVPVAPKAPVRPLPKARFIPVTNWDEDSTDAFTGLRDCLQEMAEAPCSQTRNVKSKGQLRVVMNAQFSEMFSVDEESIALLMDFELDRLVQSHQDSLDHPQSLVQVGAAFKFYLRFGTVSVAKGYLGLADAMLRRSSWRARNGLAGFNFTHERAQALSLEVPMTPTEPTPEELRAQAANLAMHARQAWRSEVRGRRISFRALYAAWSPEVSWREAIQRQGLKGWRLPGHCLYTEDKAYSASTRKGWAICHLVKLGDLVQFIKAHPEVAAKVKRHRQARQEKGAQLSLFVA